PGKDLDHPFRGNIVDICPVGALVHEDFVFKARAWDMDTAPGVCGGCSQGCNIDVNVKENQVVRVKPRYNPDVNGYWMCDEGRRHLVMTNRGMRTDVPLVRRNGALEPATWAEALEWIVEELPAGAGANGAGPAGAATAGAASVAATGTVRVSANESCENLHALSELLAHFGLAGGTFAVPRGDEVVLAGFPQLALRSERVANAAGARLLGFTEGDTPPAVKAGKLLVVLGDRLEDAAPDYGADAGFFLYLGSHLGTAARNASAVLPIAGPGEADGTFVNHAGRVQRFHQALQPSGVARPGWMVLHRLLRQYDAGRAPVRDVRDAFAAMAADGGAFEGLSWQGLGLKGARVTISATTVETGSEAR
ncbi:MAG: molybdopterin-dependent oxidoreductase, partial [Gemmatimonadota bacterium]